MADTSSSKNTVLRALKCLDEGGWIRCVHLGGKNRGASEYQLTIPFDALGKLTDKRLAEYGYVRGPRPPSPDPW